MMNFNETHELLAVIHSITAAVPANTGWLPIKGNREVAIIADIGVMTATATFDMTVEQATDSSGTGAKAIVDKDGAALVPVQLTQAGGDSASNLILMFHAEYLDVDGGYNHFRVTATPATASVSYSVLCFGVLARYEPVLQTAWQEVVGP